jgi:formyltetrahydrofolate-dependent phosphoribosylglycinamide formyltransferase
MVRIAVLASGNGSNFQAIADYFLARRETASGAVVLLASNRGDAFALERARRMSVATEVFDCTDDGASLLALLDRHRIDLIALAGYMKRIPPPVISAYHRRIVNVHPALLPDFGGPGMYGARVHKAVIASGTRTTGATVHFVDDELDHGPVIAQWRVPVEEGDTPESLAARVLAVEHQLYPRALDIVASLNGRDFFADY